MAVADVEQIIVDFLTTNVFPTAPPEDRVLVVTGGIDQLRNPQHSARLVTVEQMPSGPGDTLPTLMVADVELSFFARNRERAKSLAFAAHPALRYQLERHTDPTSGALIRQVRMLSGLAEVRWGTRDTVRYLASYRLWLHHNPL